MTLDFTIPEILSSRWNALRFQIGDQVAEFQNLAFFLFDYQQSPERNWELLFSMTQIVSHNCRFHFASPLMTSKFEEQTNWHCWIPAAGMKFMR
jgi:hypothetical protein